MYTQRLDRAIWAHKEGNSHLAGLGDSEERRVKLAEVLKVACESVRHIQESREVEEVISACIKTWKNETICYFGQSAKYFNRLEQELRFEKENKQGEGHSEETKKCKAMLQ